MSHCLYSCDLWVQLRNKESKVNKLKGVLDHLDDLEYFHPNRHQEVVTKKSVVNEMIQTTLSEARQLIVRIAHVTQKSRIPEKVVPKPSPWQTVPNETVSRPSTRQPHPMGTVPKTEEEHECLMPNILQTLRWSPQIQHVNFQADLLIYLPQFSYIKYVTPEIKHTHYCDDLRSWDNLNLGIF